MKLLKYKVLAAVVACAFGMSAFAQQQPNNGGYENWQNVGSSSEEPTNWSGMMTGNLCGFCGLGASQRVFRDGSVVHGGSYSARIQSTSYLGNIVNGNITTGEVNAPSTTPSEGYNKTVQSNANFNHPFSSYPDSVVIWAKYNITNNADSARISITLHDAYDVRDPSNAGSAPYVVARAVKNFQTGGTGTWKRISAPFNYAAYPATNVAYVLASIASSYIAGAGSSSATLWVDDMQFIYNPPVAAFSQSALTICAGQSVTFTDNTTSGSSLSWAWDFGDGGVSSSQNPSHTFNTAGTWLVQLTATNAGGSAVQTVSITVNPSPTVTASGPSAICAGSSVGISATGATSYVWDNGLGAGASQTVSPLTSTTYTVTGTTAGCSSTDQITITVNTQSNPGTATPITACISDGNVDLFGGLSGEDGGGTWSDDNATGALAGSSFNASAVSPGTYNFTYNFAANGACAPASTTTQVTVTSTVSAGSPSGLSGVCINNTSYNLFTSITGYSTGGTWFDDDMTGAVSGNTFNASLVSAGTYSFTYAFTGGTCGTDSETITLTVNAAPTIVASSDVEICIGANTPISASGATSYTWDNGLGAGSGQTVSPIATTIYTVTGTDGNGCSNTDQVTVTVNQLPSVSAGNDFSVCENSQTTLSGSGALTYIWDNGVTNGVSFTPSAATYTVTGTDANGCSNTDQVTISLYTLPTVTIGTFSVDTLCTTDAAISLPTGTPPGGSYSGAGVSGSMYDPTLVLPATHPVYYVYTDGNSCTNTAVTNITVVMCLGLFDNELVSYNVYPNPTGDILTIEFDKVVKAEMVILDDQGREVLKRSLTVEKTSIDVHTWTPGNYYVQLIDDNGQLVNTHKISVIH